MPAPFCGRNGRGRTRRIQIAGGLFPSKADLHAQVGKEGLACACPVGMPGDDILIVEGVLNPSEDGDVIAGLGLNGSEGLTKVGQGLFDRNLDPYPPAKEVVREETTQEDQSPCRSSNLESKNETSSESYNTTYFNLYPSFHLTYNITEQKSIQFAITERVERPGSGGHGEGSRQIRPFPRDIYTDQFIFIGNPLIF